MPKLLLCFILGGFLIICHSQDVAANNPVTLLQQYRAAEQIYRQAEKMSQRTGDARAQAHAAQLYRDALAAFGQLTEPALRADYDSLTFCIYLRTGDIYFKKQKRDSALIFYTKAEQIDNSYTFLLNEPQLYYTQLRHIEIPHGLLYKYKADQLAAAGRYYEAIGQYHQAILQLELSYSETDIYKNPVTFSNTSPFSYLFPVLIRKAEAFTHLRPGQKNIKALNGAAGAYHAAFLLAEQVKLTDPEKAQEAMDAFKDLAQNAPIRVNMELYELTGRKEYLEEAYLLDQRTKTTAILKTPVPPIDSLQQLIDRRTAILSYYVSSNELTTFIITRMDVAYHTEPIDQNFLTDIDSFRLSLTNNAGSYNADLAKKLYGNLVSPIYKKLKGIKRLIIITDDKLRHLPFEALQNDDKKYLLEEYAVQYQYSTALLGKKYGRSAEPCRSFSTSYPGNSNDFNTYTDHVHGLHLDTAHLVILDTEHAGKQLLQNNSLMSLSQAFSDAGCPNMITSLWKSEDEAALFVNRQLHEYLSEGYSRDKALQKARLDLLRSYEIDTRFKTPAHWANMILIGQYEPPYSPTPWILISIIASVIAAVVWVITVKSNY